MRTRGAVVLLVLGMGLLLGGMSSAGSSEPARAGAGATQACDLMKSLPPAPLPPIETFMQIGVASNPRLSADGERLFFESGMSGVEQLYRLTPEGWPYQITFGADGVGSSSFNRDCTLAVLGTDRGGNEQYQLSLLDTQTGALRPLTSNPKVRHTSVVWSPDGCSFYYAANAEDPASFCVYRMDPRDARSDLVLKKDGSNAPLDVSPDGRFLAVFHAVSSLNHDVYLLNRENGSLDLLTPHEGDHFYEGGAFSADGRFVYLLTDNNPDRMLRLARIDVTTKKCEFVFGGDPRWEVETFSLSDNRRFLVTVVNEEGYGRIHLYDLSADRELPAPQQPGIAVTPVPVDAGYLIYTYTSAVRTGDVWIWDFRNAAGLVGESATGSTGSGSANLGSAAPAGAPPSVSAGGTGAPFWLRASVNPARLTFSSYAGVDPEIFKEPLLVRYRSFDGLEIPAFLYLPPGYEKGPIPVIIDVHGGPESQFRPYFSRHFQYLLQRGFGIFAPNFRGSTGYGRPFEEADNYKNRPAAVKDVAAGAEWLIRNGYSARGRIGVKGGSYGGYMTLAAMAEYPDLFSAGIDQVGIANFETFLENTADYRRALRESEYGPLTDREFLRSISPLYKADRIKGALLVVHGLNDPRVPVGEARQILRAVAKQGTPADSLIFADEGHGVSKRPNLLVFYRKMAEFFEKYLKSS